MTENLWQKLLKPFRGISVIGQIDSIAGTARTEDLRTWDRNDPTYKQLVVFVHGFQSNKDSAWGQFLDLIKADSAFAGFNLHRFGYPTAIVGQTSDIEHEGDFFASFLQETLPRYRFTILVGHSMGGLVILHALLTLERDTFQLLRDANISVLTFGTPYQGVKNTAALAALFHNQQAKDMAVFSNHYLRLKENWERRFNRLPAPNERETIQITVRAYSGTADEFVAEASARGAPGPVTDRGSVDGDHRSMVKPKNRDHLAYLKLRAMVPTEANQDLDSRAIGTTIRKEAAGPLLRFDESMEADAVSVVLALERLRSGSTVKIQWPEASDVLLASAERLAVDASKYRHPASLFHGWRGEEVSTFLQRMSVSAAENIRAGRGRVERRLVHLVQGAAPYFGPMGGTLNETVRNYLTLSNHELHGHLAYRLTHKQLPQALLPRIWHDLMMASHQQSQGGIRRLFHINGKLVHARIRNFSGRDWFEYCWGPFEVVRQAVKPGALGTDWCVKYVIPQLEFKLAYADSAEVVFYEEGIKIDKASLLEYGENEELSLYTFTKLSDGFFHS